MAFPRPGTDQRRGSPMRTIATHLMLLAALVLPVASFLLLLRMDRGALLPAVVSIAAGWALNVIWAGTADPRNGENYRSIATRFGWACPAVLVFATWAVRHFAFSAAP